MAHVERDVTVRLNWSQLLCAPPSRRRGCVASKLQNVVFELDLSLGLSNWAIGL